MHKYRTSVQKARKTWSQRLGSIWVDKRDMPAMCQKWSEICGVLLEECNSLKHRGNNDNKVMLYNLTCTCICQRPEHEQEKWSRTHLLKTKKTFIVLSYYKWQISGIYRIHTSTFHHILSLSGLGKALSSVIMYNLLLSDTHWQAYLAWNLVGGWLYNIWVTCCCNFDNGTLAAEHGQMALPGSMMMSQNRTNKSRL